MRTPYRVKEKIELKELEKYGYTKNDSGEYIKYIDGNWWDYLVVDNEEKYIQNFTEEIGYWTFDDPRIDDIQDLIDAGIAEVDDRE